MLGCVWLLSCALALSCAWLCLAQSCAWLCLGQSCAWLCLAQSCAWLWMVIQEHLLLDGNETTVLLFFYRSAYPILINV